MLLILTVVAVIVGNGHKVVACANSNCFEEHFAQCTPATYTYADAGNSVEYTIGSKQSIGCTVSARYLKSQYISDIAGKTMTCEFDNTKSFQVASQNAFHYPLDYGCVGSLADEFKT